MIHRQSKLSRFFRHLCQENCHNRAPLTLTRADKVSVDSTLAALKADIEPTCRLFFYFFDNLKKIRDSEQSPSEK